ncbi:hypothetical protein ABTY53_06765 [Streptomyces noursei]|uniref:hypothetical protein n=1 Tax=Streptomyces noursei TaxID=1971 RepID=UPI003330D962
METYLVLVRFGVLVGGLVALALLVFAVALALKRRGRLDDARRYADPVVRAGLRAAVRRIEDGGRRGSPGARRGDGRR